MRTEVKTKKANLPYLFNNELLEWCIIICFLIFSFLNSITLLIWLLSLFLFLKQKEIGAIKIINLITLRTIINSEIAVNIGVWQDFKWLLIFICSFILLNSYFKLRTFERKKINLVIFPIGIFISYSILTDLFYSSLPIISIFKVLSFGIPFVAIIIGVNYTFKEFNWLRWLFILIMGLVIIGIPSLFFNFGYARNGYSFQGLTNQPNMLGLILIISLALTLSLSFVQKNMNQLIFLSFIGSSIVMIIFTDSRTALISSAILIVIYIVSKRIKNFLQISIVSFSFVLVFLFLINDNIKRFIVNFMLKNQSDILVSRENQITELLTNFYLNPLWGTGFAVPYLPQRYFIFSSEYVVEPGNIFLAVLSYSGIIGFVLFSVFMINILLKNIENFRYAIYLYLSPLLISMGEMVFFSTNNIGIWCYMLLAIYITTSSRSADAIIPNNSLSKGEF